MPSDPFYTRPAPGPSADDSVAENINRLEKIHERLNELQKTSNYTPKGKRHSYKYFWGYKSICRL